MSLREAKKEIIDGCVGNIELRINEPDSTIPEGCALIAHPHPLHGGTLDNKVVQTLTRALLDLGNRVFRFNFRGVGESEGSHDNGIGEVEDMRAVFRHMRITSTGLPVTIAGFSFGASVAAKVSLLEEVKQLIAVAPAVKNFPVAGIPKNTLLIQGSEDDLIDMDQMINWANSENVPVVVIPGATHFFHGKLTMLREIVVQFGAKL